MNYQETLNYMYTQLPMFQKVGGSAFKKSLDNIYRLCDHLGKPQKKFKSIHVAGTNGKGSSSHLLTSILMEAGYQTGLYTSPHLKSFTERIKVNGAEMEEGSVIDFIQENKQFIEEISPSFFEITVAMAFQYFAKKKVDYAVIEVGLGGRLDSTNIILPELSLITNIGFDHMDFLGTTLPEIAGEKAGIIKEGVPVVISESQQETTEVFQTIAQKQNAPIHFADSIFNCKRISGSDQVSIHKRDKISNREFHLPLIGSHQLKNLCGVLTAMEVLVDKGAIKINQNQLEKGIENVLKNTGLKGRWQELSRQPKIVCDVGHNEEGIKMILDQIKQTQFVKLFMVWGMVKDKEIKKILNLLPKEAYYLFCQPEIPRGLNAETLGETAFSQGLKGEVIHSVKDAIKKAKLMASPDDFIFIGGSTFVVAEIEEL
ncbi:bifunctional folylpolyglutamate synthase/dihydrofolate synthase [Flexithrix dorotheae]|uniref:bifunctional folylpolyglutamate synthase/dihydrofolate synthase n=1 Tax=Flexithrix dorotheae TaxID=70993 RepID=UPI00037DE7AB|nr:folylpolyglutamate synthase/dihydrofolate synthase family protein [Flexithrix dorotheae]